MQGELQRLRSLTDLEVRAIVSETRVDTSDIRGVTAEILSKSRIADAKNTEFTSQVLCELQVLNQREYCGALYRIPCVYCEHTSSCTGNHGSRDHRPRRGKTRSRTE